MTLISFLYIFTGNFYQALNVTIAFRQNVDEQAGDIYTIYICIRAFIDLESMSEYSFD